MLSATCLFDRNFPVVTQDVWHQKEAYKTTIPGTLNNLFLMHSLSFCSACPFVTGWKRAKVMCQIRPLSQNMQNSSNLNWAP